LEFETTMRVYANQIPHDKGIQAWIGYRDMIGNMFPGNMPAPAGAAILTIIAANAVSSLLEQMEAGLEFDTPGAVGRRKAVAELFEKVLDHASDQREELRLKKLFAGQGGVVN
jgi:hypothetical protein